MQDLRIEDRLFDGPTSVCVEASIEVIHDLNLSTTEGEHYQRIADVLVIRTEGAVVVFETCRTLDNPGRYRVEIPASAIARVWI